MTTPSAGFVDALAGRDGTQAVATRFRPPPVYPDPTSALSARTAPRVVPVRVQVSVPARPVTAGSTVVDAPATQAVTAQPRRPAPPAVSPTAWAGPTGRDQRQADPRAASGAGAARPGQWVQTSVPGAGPATPPPRSPLPAMFAAPASRAPAAPMPPRGSMYAPQLGASAPTRASITGPNPNTAGAQSDAQLLLRNAMQQFRAQQGPARPGRPQRYDPASQSRTKSSPKAWAYVVVWLAVIGIFLFSSGWSLIARLFQQFFH